VCTVYRAVVLGLGKKRRGEEKEVGV